MNALLRTAACLTLASFSFACARQMPPPAAPEKVVPVLDVEPAPPVDGSGRVVLDAQGERARVVEIVGTSSATVIGGYGYGYGAAATVVSIDTRPVCVTPCVANLPYGSHELVFASQLDANRRSHATVDVGRSTSVFRHAMGGKTTHRGARVTGIVSLVLGGVGGLTGLGLYAAGAARADTTTSIACTRCDGTEPSRSAPMDTGDGFRSAGVVAFGISGALLVAGTVLLILGRDEVQPGSSTQWVMPGGAPAAAPTGESIMFRY